MKYGLRRDNKTMTPEERSDRLLSLVERIAVALEKQAGVTLAAPRAESPAAPGTIPLCPKCKEPMLLRSAKRTGDQFWGCRSFPGCNGLRRMDGVPVNTGGDGNAF